MKKLQAQWSFELAPLKALASIDLEESLHKSIVAEIQAEIDAEIMRSFYTSEAVQEGIRIQQAIERGCAEHLADAVNL